MLEVCNYLFYFGLAALLLGTFFRMLLSEEKNILKRIFSAFNLNIVQEEMGLVRLQYMGITFILAMMVYKTIFESIEISSNQLLLLLVLFIISLTSARWLVPLLQRFKK